MAAGATYTPIQTISGNGSSSSFTFSSIPQTYTDLVLVTSAKVTSSQFNASIQVNGNSSSSYSVTYLVGDGSAAGSGRYTNQTAAYTDDAALVNSSNFNTGIVNFMNYSNTTTYKTILARTGNASTGVNASVNLWRNTSAITSITWFGGIALTSGSTLTLYGIASA